jgi:hypothetical protein
VRTSRFWRTLCTGLLALLAPSCYDDRVVVIGEYYPEPFPWEYETEPDWGPIEYGGEYGGGGGGESSPAPVEEPPPPPPCPDAKNESDSCWTELQRNNNASVDKSLACIESGKSHEECAKVLDEAFASDRDAYQRCMAGVDLICMGG